MILPFSQKFQNGQPTYFAEKINKGIANSIGIDGILILLNYDLMRLDHKELQPTKFMNGIKPKLHTIRADNKNRWRKGKKIHPYYNNRTKKAFQIAPTILCKSTQQIEIVWYSNYSYHVIVENIVLHYHQIEILAINDGFDNVEHFMSYFESDIKGKIIHWTDLRYNFS